MEKQEEIEKASLEDLAKIEKFANQQKVRFAVVGGYAVRAHAKAKMRYTKDIDIAVQRAEDLPKLKRVLERADYAVRERPHGLSGYKKVHGIAIVVNAIVVEVKRVKKTVASFYPRVSKPIRVNVASLEDTLALKTLLWRDRDIVDVCLLLLNSSGSIDIRRLKSRLQLKSNLEQFIGHLRQLLGFIGSRRLHTVWREYMGRRIEKSEETELWKRIGLLLEALE